MGIQVGRRLISMNFTAMLERSGVAFWVFADLLDLAHDFLDDVRILSGSRPIRKRRMFLKARIPLVPCALSTIAHHHLLNVCLPSPSPIPTSSLPSFSDCQFSRRPIQQLVEYDFEAYDRTLSHGNQRDGEEINGSLVRSL